MISRRRKSEKVKTKGQKATRKLKYVLMYRKMYYRLVFITITSLSGHALPFLLNVMCVFLNVECKSVKITIKVNCRRREIVNTKSEQNEHDVRSKKMQMIVMYFVLLYCIKYLYFSSRCK